MQINNEIEKGFFICDGCGVVHHDVPMSLDNGIRQMIFPTSKCKIKAEEGNVNMMVWWMNNFTTRETTFPCRICKKKFHAKKLRCMDVEKLNGAICFTCIDSSEIWTEEEKQTIRKTPWICTFCSL